MQIKRSRLYFTSPKYLIIDSTAFKENFKPVFLSIVNFDAIFLSLDESFLLVLNYDLNTRISNGFN